MININEQIPNVTLKVMGQDGPLDIDTRDLFNNKKVILFSVPGAFTPTCSAAHLPGFVVNADKFKSKGIDEIVCMSVNDVFVMDAWGKSSNAEEITMLADGNGEFAKALGLEVDGTAWGMGLRSKRFAMIVDDGEVKQIAVDDKGLEKSSAEAVLAML
ncbi:peroxiredoxin [Kangiella sp. HZ709]|uniref:peroxiredoxin n=1 Tax=Kangiella sp. HZ709 TaxID=2666328 RepID=UPI0012AF5A20|nr:peroxiredoxin [Kangiella sp. HZ709]MRX26634.1 redoxin family protein [Kangiella sp. HZ709]